MRSAEELGLEGLNGAVGCRRKDADVPVSSLEEVTNSSKRNDCISSSKRNYYN